MGNSNYDPQSVDEKSKIVSYSYISERIDTVRLKVDKGPLTVIGVCVSEKVEKMISNYNPLQKVLTNAMKSDYICLLEAVMLELEHFLFREW